jgi:hypothetical protein
VRKGKPQNVTTAPVARVGAWAHRRVYLLMVGGSTVADSAAGAAGAAPIPVSQASTSTRGVTKSSINVVFPVVNLTSLAGRLVPFNAVTPVPAAETSQNYFPKLLLSDYESSIESSLNLIPVPYEKALNGQEGVTVETLDGIDDPRPQAAGCYDPGVRSCCTPGTRHTPRFPRAT